MKILAALLVATGTVLANAAPALSADTVMERFFRGQTQASGTFRAINGTRRDLDISLRGTVKGDTLVLREDIRYSDGKKERKTWRFVRTGPDTYRGTREDVIGDTTVRVTDHIARFNYLIDLDPGPKQDIYRFYDTLVFSRDGRSVANTAVVWKAIFPVARARIDFRK